MNEFIVYDIFNDHFYKRENYKTQREFLDDILKAEEGGNHLTYHNYIGKTDINDKKIYADSSVVEFYILDNYYVGFFTYNKDKLHYEICTDHWTGRYDSGMQNLKIIDTIQENKLGLIK